MLFVNDQGVEPYLGQINALSDECFSCNEVSVADYRFVELDINGKLIAHSAIHKRPFEIIDKSIDSFLLGYVSVQKEFRGSGYGRLAVEEILAPVLALPHYAVLLNCSEKNSHFYEKFGFVKISERASYTRDGKFEIDEDPVMILYKIPSVLVFPWYDIVHLGEDF